MTYISRPSDQPVPIVELVLKDSSYPIVRSSDEIDCRIDVLSTVRTGPKVVLGYAAVRGPESDRFTRVVSGDGPVDRVTVLEESMDGCIVQVVLRECIVHSLTDEQIDITHASSRDGELRITGILPLNEDPELVIAAIREQYPELEVSEIRDREFSTPIFFRQQFRTVLEDRLTDRQLEALSLAYKMDYFSDSLSVTQSDLAAQMGISQETFSSHLRKAHRRLLRVVFGT